MALMWSWQISWQMSWPSKTRRAGERRGTDRANNVSKQKSNETPGFYFSIARMLGKYSKIKVTKEAMQACSQSKVQIAVSAAKALIPLSSHADFHLLSLYRLRCETWIERETVNGRLRARLKPCREFVECQKLVKKFTVVGCPSIDLAPRSVVHGVELQRFGPRQRTIQIGKIHSGMSSKYGLTRAHCLH